MTITVIDDQTTLTPVGQNLHEMAATLTGTTYLSRRLTSDTLGGIKTAGTQRIIVSDVTAAPDEFDIDTNLSALTLAAAGSSVINEGALRSATAAAIAFSGGGVSTVTNATGKTIKGARGIEITSASGTDRLELLNAGTIEAIDATGTAVIGGLGDDRIINSGTIKATGASGTALDLKGGNDLYDGRSGGSVVGTIKLGLGDDIAYGGNENETFSGGAGSNVIHAGAGNDTILGGDGNNTINGGGSVDAIDYTAATDSQTSPGVTVNLGTGIAFGNGFADTLSGIENVIGSGHNDTLTGSFDDNTLKGGAGDDILEGGNGNDSLDGGNGNNTARFTGSTAATVDLSNAAAQATGYGSDILTGIRNLEGGSGADKLKGSAQDNRFDGNGGSDTLEGVDGKDTLLGEAGSDSLVGGAGNDTLEGGNDNDTLVGGAGNDDLQGGTGRNTAVFSGNSDRYTIIKNDNGTFTVTDRSGQDGADTLKDIRFAQFADKTVALTNGAPRQVFPSISPTNVSESAAVGSRVTTLSSSDPDGDTISYSLVTDAGGLFRLNGRELLVNRALDYETATQHTISVKASDGLGGEVTTTLTINVGNNGNETTPLVKTGTAASDEVVGENGNDQLRGLGGNDEIFGLGGSDKLWGGAGNDALIGGAGRDIFVFDAKPHARTNLDNVYDFNVPEDTIHLSKKIFSKIAKKGTLSKDAFVVGDRFKDAQDRILYHKKGGGLFYDPDGTGGQKAVQFATIGKNLAISHKDFWIF
jgi:Ca2+-binding RTX toxin-like protein